MCGWKAELDIPTRWTANPRLMELLHCNLNACEKIIHHPRRPLGDESMKRSDVQVSTAGAQTVRLPSRRAMYRIDPALCAKQSLTPWSQLLQLYKRLAKIQVDREMSSVAMQHAEQTNNLQSKISSLLGVHERRAMSVGGFLDFQSKVHMIFFPRFRPSTLTVPQNDQTRFLCTACNPRIWS